MLSKPEHGWTLFHLEGTSEYDLSYLDNIPEDWLEQAIHGLEKMQPFCVKGYLEPTRFLCVVSYYNCRIILEDEDDVPLTENKTEISHTSMIDFCKMLYDDISSDINEWSGFYASVCNSDNGLIKKAELSIRQKLEKLRSLINEKEKFWGEGYCFL